MKRLAAMVVAVALVLAVSIAGTGYFPWPK